MLRVNSARHLLVSKSRSFAALTMTGVLLAGCGGMSVTPHGPRQPNPVPGVDPTIGTGGTIKGAEAETRRTAGANSRVICRSAGIPSGYVAIDYTTSRSCTQSADSAKSFNATVILYIRAMPSGSVVRMCKDQTVPRGWYRTWNDEDSGQCPRPRASRASESNTMEIRKGG